MPTKRFEPFTLDELKVLRLSLTGASYSTKKAEEICMRLCKEMDRSLTQKQTIATLDKNYNRKKPKIASSET